MKKKFNYKKRKLNESKNKIRTDTLSFEIQKNPNLPYFKNNTMTNNKLIKLNIKNNNYINEGKNKLFKNIKLYRPIKNNNHIKRNLSFKLTNLNSEDKFTNKFNNNIKLNYNLYDLNHTLTNSKNYLNSRNNPKSFDKKLFKSKSNSNALIPHQIYDNNRGEYINNFLKKANYNSSLIKNSYDNEKTFSKNHVLAEKLKSKYDEDKIK